LSSGIRAVIAVTFTVGLILSGGHLGVGPASDTPSVDAHPGGTDGNGCHTCRTNCTERWGIPYGFYHRHDPVRPCFAQAPVTEPTSTPVPPGAEAPEPTQQSPPPTATSEVAGVVAEPPDAGLGIGSVNTNNPFVWLIAGLTGAGIAWMLSGLAFGLRRPASPQSSDVPLPERGQRFVPTMRPRIKR
jgi:hypothetical protein